jgi:hypothetical protein
MFSFDFGSPKDDLETLVKRVSKFERVREAWLRTHVHVLCRSLNQYK